MANKKAEILTMDGQVVSPITLATNVLLDDGRTAQDLLDSRDESMFSPTITTSSSISKVGQGDNVDFSENVIDGAYKSCVLKGKTLVNYNTEGNNRNEYVCMPSVEGESVTVNGTVEGLVKSAILKGQTLVNLIDDTKNTKNKWLVYGEPTIDENGIWYFQSDASLVRYTQQIIPVKNNTTYTAFLKCKNKNTNNNNAQIGLYLESIDGGSRIAAAQENILSDDFVLLKCKITTTTHNSVTFRMHSRGLIGEAWFKEPIFIEGDYTNVDIPYFEGIQSVKMPVLKTTGKNLFGGSLITTNDARRFELKGFELIDGEKYALSYNFSKDGAKTHQLQYMTNSTSNPTYLSAATTSTSECKLYFTVPKDLARLFIYTNDWSSNLEHFSNIQIEQGTQVTPYDPHKSNILSCNEEVILRGIGDVKDTLDLTTGELTQRIGEIVLDGSEDWVLGRDTTHATNGRVLGFKIQIQNLYTEKWNAVKADTIVCDKLKVTSQFNQFTGEVYNSISQYSPTEIQIMIKAINDSLNDTLNELKRMLSENPVTVIYPVNDVIKTVDLSDNHVYSYNDTTHYTCSSAEGSLIPTLSIEEGVKYQAIIKPSTKYSIIFNRTVASDSLTVDLGGATTNITSTTLGKNIVQITTPPTLSHNYVIFKGLGNVIKDVQVIEGEVADDVEYFEGMIDVENPVVTNCNMLDVDSVDYKSNTISTNEVVLRSLPNGVCDTLDLMTGEYVQRVGEGVLNGTEDGWVANATKEKTQVFELDAWNNAVTSMNGKNNNNLYCDKCVAGSGIDRELISFYVGHIYIALLKKNASTVEELKTYLQSNPITVQYELATPIITTIDLKQHPFAYKDGYVVLSSNSEKSLTPTIEYSLIANRLGQIQSNQKLVEKQQAQINELESMVITNLVNTQYQQALNEIKLGVK